MLLQIKKTTYITLGFLCVLLALIGAALPVLPTTPFALLAAFFFSRSSAKFHRWLLSLPLLGKLIHNWEKHRVITLKAKVNSTFIMVCFFLWSFYRFKDSFIIWMSIALIMTGVLIFIWTRKSKIIDQVLETRQ